MEKDNYSIPLFILLQKIIRICISDCAHICDPPLEGIECVHLKISGATCAKVSKVIDSGAGFFIEEEEEEEQRVTKVVHQPGTSEISPKFMPHS